MTQVNDIIAELIAAADEEDFVGSQQDFYHSELLRKAAEFIQKNISNTIAKLEWKLTGDNYWFSLAPVTGKVYSIIFEEGMYLASWDATIPPSELLGHLQNIAQADFEAEIREAFE